ncbi:MAG TPA: type II toxin-antitoxin system VapC family toxin [Polyangiaceae bacterium]|nr:type II toxin-antitoxin system VapC family toxin [Polyangiaceae bacterium]
MRIAIDSNRYDDLITGSRDVAEIVETADAVYLPFVVVGELRAGFATGTRQAENERLLRRFLMKDDVEILFADAQTTHHYASAYAQLRRQGTPIPTNDLWIAALVLQHDLSLCTRDRHFDKLAQIPRV